eukprot:s502_g32.t1
MRRRTERLVAWASKGNTFGRGPIQGQHQYSTSRSLPNSPCRVQRKAQQLLQQKWRFLKSREKQQLVMRWLTLGRAKTW